MTTQINGRAAWRYCVLLGTLLLACGCQTAPGQLAGCCGHTANANPKSVLAQQILCDTGEEIAHHPLRVGRIVLHDQAAWFGALGRGIFGKRIGMHLHGVPPVLETVSVRV